MGTTTNEFEYELVKDTNKFQYLFGCLLKKKEKVVFKGKIVVMCQDFIFYLK